LKSFLKANGGQFGENPRMHFSTDSTRPYASTSGKSLGFFGLLLSTCLTACGQTSPSASAQPAASNSQTAIAPASPAAKTLAERIKKELVHLPGGTFEMGDWGNADGLPYEAETNNKPVHTVTLDGFSVMAYKVTYEDFDLFTDTVGEQRIDQTKFSLKFRAPRKPAGVNWFGAKAYCAWLGKLTGLSFDLLTEAQWEYAARSGGKKLLFATDNGKIDKDRNYPWDTEDQRTPDIGTYPPNPAGLYGMLDYFASEWVNDWYAPDYYKNSPPHNPKGPVVGQPAQVSHPEFGPGKVIRGHSSPGNSPAFGGFVFSRGGKTPKEVRPDFAGQYPGFSGWSTAQFRCAVN
jgi:sulfatase modifying factor 1